MPDEQAEPDEIATPAKVERHQQRFGFGARHGETAGVRQPRGGRSEHDEVIEQGDKPRLQPVAKGRDPRLVQRRGLFGRHSEAGNADDVFRARTQAELLPAPLDQRSIERHALGQHHRTRALRSAELMAGKKRCVGAASGKIEPDPPDRLDGITHEQAARFMNQGDSSLQRLNHTRFVVGGLERHQGRSPAVTQSVAQIVEIEPAVRPHRQNLNPIMVEPMPLQHGRMLGRNGDQPIGPTRRAHASQGRRQQQVRRFGAARCERHPIRRSTHQPTDATSRFLDEVTRGAAFLVDRGRIAVGSERMKAGAQRSRPERRRRIVIEIGPRRDHLVFEMPCFLPGHPW